MYSFKNIYTYVGHEISETENRMETKEKMSIYSSVIFTFVKELLYHLENVGYKLSVHL